MKNVNDFLKNWMNGDLLGRLCDFLRDRDPEFSALETARTVTEDTKPLLEVHNRQANADLLFAVWQGLRLNLENFRQPVGNCLLTQDFSQLVREHILFSMSPHRRAQQELGTLTDALSPNARETLEGINEFYIYLETVGLKVAHYLGFRLGDLLFSVIEPGYVPDAAATQTYRMELERYLGFPLD